MTGLKIARISAALYKTNGILLKPILQLFAKIMLQRDDLDSFN